MPLCRTLLPPCLSLCLSLAPLPASAHPHVYIDAGVTLLFDGSGQLTGLDVAWSYDELYSLLIIADLGMDEDGDGLLTPEESKALDGFDGDWDADFDGRVYLSYAGQAIEMQAPRKFTADYRDGKLISHHLHPLAQPMALETTLRIQVYDPEFYVDFSMPEAPVMQGRTDCRAELIVADPDAAAEAYRAAVEQALAETGQDSEMVVVDIGPAGADEARIVCGAGE